MAFYPDIDDDNFQYKISSKLEFRLLESRDHLYKQQEFVRRFLSPYTPYKSLILFHNLGSGKSIACIAVAVDHYMYNGKKCVIVTKGQSGTETFINQIALYHTQMSSCKDKWNNSIFCMQHYMSLSHQINDMADDDIIAAYSNKIIILDEVHNVRYLSNETKSVYSSIIRMLRLCNNVKVLLATATPMTDNPDQLKSLLGIANYFRPEKEYEMRGIISYNPYVVDKPISCYKGIEGIIPGLRVHVSYMTGYQKDAYASELLKGTPNDIYRSLTHVSLFSFPLHLNAVQNVTDHSSTLEHFYNKKEAELGSGVYGRPITSTMMTKTKHTKTITSMSTGQTKNTNYIKFQIKSEFAHMLSGDMLDKCSCKYSALMRVLEGSTGNVFVFVEEVKGSGLLLLACVLEQHGYELYVGEHIQRIKPNPKRYTLCVGSTDLCPNIQDRLDGFNSPYNKDGSFVRVLLGSRVIGESITLLNVRQFHCITPHWNDSTIHQAVGRVVRNGSHNALDPDQRFVDIYLHTAIFSDNVKDYNNIDVKKLMICNDKQIKIQSVEKNMKKLAVDRYCITPKSVTYPITDFITFAAAYTPYYIDYILERINELIQPNKTLDINTLCTILSIPEDICKEAVCTIIQRNMLLTYNSSSAESVENIGTHDQSKLLQLYLRAYDNFIFTVSDPSVPYVTLATVPDFSPKPFTEHSSDVIKNLSLRTNKYNLTPDPYAIRRQQNPIDTSTLNTDRMSIVSLFRHLSVKQKASFIEECIFSYKEDILQYINTVFANIEGSIYHLLWYRDLESSYTSSNPVPKKPEGKTRCFSGGTWYTLRIEEEKDVLIKYKELVNELMDYVDKHPVYGIISTIDGRMRLRLRSYEQSELSIYDHRYVKRGKSIRSIKKNQLLKILQSLNSPFQAIDTVANILPNPSASSFIPSTLHGVRVKGVQQANKGNETMHNSNSATINDIIQQIDSTLINAGLYAII